VAGHDASLLLFPYLELDMTKIQNMANLQASGQAKPLVRQRTKKEMLLICAGVFRKMSLADFDAIYEVEFMALDDLRAMPTKGTPLERVVHHLNDMGIAVGHTIGEFMDVTQMTKDDLHEVACFCHGPVITGTVAAKRLHLLAHKLV
jgi:hypothetical protein